MEKCDLRNVLQDKVAELVSVLSVATFPKIAPEKQMESGKNKVSNTWDDGWGELWRWGRVTVLTWSMWRGCFGPGLEGSP